MTPDQIIAVGGDEFERFTNPVRALHLDDWPSGRHRVACEFRVEVDAKRGERVARRTEKAGAPGVWQNWKRTTYADEACIVTSERDGRTWILTFSRRFGCFELHPGTMGPGSRYVTGREYPRAALHLRELLDQSRKEATNGAHAES